MTRVSPRHSRRHGVVLVIVMWLLLVVGLLVLGLSRNARVAASLGHSEVEGVQARWLARAGVEQALAVLAGDLTSHDGRGDDWFDNPGRFENIELATGHSFRVTAPALDRESDPTLPRFGLDDEASRVNVNAQRPNQLRRLPEITDAQADALLDWRDENEAARAGGAERGYYRDLDHPYLIRNGPLRTHRELLLIKGFEPAAFFGEDGNLDGTLQRSENDGQASWPEDDADRQLLPGLAAYTTVYSYEPNTTLGGAPRVDLSSSSESQLTTALNLTAELATEMVDTGRDADSLFDFVGLRGGGSPEDETQTDEVTLEWLARVWETLTLEDDDRLPGKINVNTAGREVLLTVPGMRAEMADAILGQRSSQGDFTGVGALHRRSVLNDRQFQRVANFLTVRSQVFRVVSEGRTPSGTTHTLAVIVDRGGQQPFILDWRQP